MIQHCDQIIPLERKKKEVVAYRLRTYIHPAAELLHPCILDSQVTLERAIAI